MAKRKQRARRSVSSDDRDHDDGSLLAESPGPSPTKKKKTAGTPSSASASASAEDKVRAMDNKILAVMFEFYMDKKFDATLTEIASRVGCQERTKSFRERWTVLKNDKQWIGRSENNGAKGCFQLTKAGVDQAATPEYKEMLKELSIKPKTNRDHQERIKKYFQKPKTVLMFDHFFEYGSLFPNEMVGLIGQNRRSHGYHYSWKELKVKQLIEPDPNHEGSKPTKFRLSAKAFLSEEDRPDPESVDRKKLAEEVKSGHDTIESRRHGGVKKTKTTKQEQIEKEQAAVKEEVAEKDEEEQTDEVSQAAKVEEEPLEHEDEPTEPIDLGAEKEKENENENAADGPTELTDGVHSDLGAESTNVVGESEIPIPPDIYV